MSVQLRFAITSDSACCTCSGTPGHGRLFVKRWSKYVKLIRHHSATAKGVNVEPAGAQPEREVAQEALATDQHDAWPFSTAPLL